MNIFNKKNLEGRGKRDEPGWIAQAGPEDWTDPERFSSDYTIFVSFESIQVSLKPAGPDTYIQHPCVFVADSDTYSAP